MATFEVNKTYKEINEKIAAGNAVILTAEEMISMVENEGPVRAAQKVDVVTTGTFAPMCSSGAFINFGHSSPGTKASKVWLNGVPAYGGIAAVDCYLGATELPLEDPLNKVYPGNFNYGGGHVIEDLLLGKRIHVRAEGYGTDCYPNRFFEKDVTLKELPYAVLCNPRNAYQNYNCAINTTKKTIYTYMGVLRPRMGNANYCNAGALSPLMNDPCYKTIGLGTRIFLGGGVGYVTWSGTQHKPQVKRHEENDTPLTPAGTLFVMGDLKQMKPEWLRGVSIRGYGASISVGLGIPIPILNEEMARYTGVKDSEIFTQVVDYGVDYPAGTGRTYGQVSYEMLKSGKIVIEGKEIPTVPISSMVKAREIAATLKEWMEKGAFFLGEPQFLLPGPF